MSFTTVVWSTTFQSKRLVYVETDFHLVLCHLSAWIHPQTLSLKTVSYEYVTQETWNEAAINLFRSIISAAIYVRIKMVKMKDQHLFGCLQIETKQGENKFVHDIMVESDMAKLSADFFNGNLLAD